MPKSGRGLAFETESAGKIPSGGKNLLKDAYQYVKDTGEKDVVKKASLPKVEITHPLSDVNKKHINKHNVDSLKQQAKHMTDEQLEKKLKKNSYFNPKWSKEEINKYSEIAYNDLRQQGKTGELTYEIAGEKLKVFIHPNGSFGSVYGQYKFTVDEFKKLLK
ncbi:hypothetical protein CN354_12615 [Bacillus cereus]|nr:hypothetical protein CN354_12615 [Bacillus cereus]WJE54719.1 hypothetical protein QRE66_11085 [Bacillus cereus]